MKDFVVVRLGIFFQGEDLGFEVSDGFVLLVHPLLDQTHNRPEMTTETNL
jgi:hypothetical protein